MTTTDDRLERIEQRVEGIEHRVSGVEKQTEFLNQQLKTVIDELGQLRFEFKTSQSTSERLERYALSLITGAVVSIIVGVVFLLVRELI